LRGCKTILLSKPRDRIVSRLYVRLIQDLVKMNICRDERNKCAVTIGLGPISVSTSGSGVETSRGSLFPRPDHIVSCFLTISSYLVIHCVLIILSPSKQFLSNLSGRARHLPTPGLHNTVLGRHGEAPCLQQHNKSSGGLNYMVRPFQFALKIL
jgi:hypothetical protein